MQWQFTQFTKLIMSFATCKYCMTCSFVVLNRTQDNAFHNLVVTCVMSMHSSFPSHSDNVFVSFMRKHFTFIIAFPTEALIPQQVALAVIDMICWGHDPQ